MKAGWNLISSPTSLWTKVLLTKYGLNHENLLSVLPTRNGSYLRKSIGKVWNDTIMGIQWNIGDGKKVRFWWDCWVTKAQPLIVHAMALILLILLIRLLLSLLIHRVIKSFSHLLPNISFFELIHFGHQ